MFLAVIISVGDAVVAGKLLAEMVGTKWLLVHRLGAATGKVASMSVAVIITVNCLSYAATKTKVIATMSCAERRCMPNF